MADEDKKSEFNMGAFNMGALSAMGTAYQHKLLEFAQENAKAALEYATALGGCRSPVDFMNVTQDYSRRQMETVQRQTAELLDLAKSPPRSP
jgi:hypothetical protein